MLDKIIPTLKKLDHLITIRGTGTPAKCAERIGTSERSLYEYLKFMKDNGAKVKYSRTRDSYYYEEPGTFVTFQFLKEQA